MCLVGERSDLEPLYDYQKIYHFKNRHKGLERGLFVLIGTILEQCIKNWTTACPDLGPHLKTRLFSLVFEL